MSGPQKNRNLFQNKNVEDVRNAFHKAFSYLFRQFQLFLVWRYFECKCSSLLHLPEKSFQVNLRGYLSFQRFAFAPQKFTVFSRQRQRYHLFDASSQMQPILYCSQFHVINRWAGTGSFRDWDGRHWVTCSFEVSPMSLHSILLTNNLHTWKALRVFLKCVFVNWVCPKTWIHFPQKNGVRVWVFKFQREYCLSFPKLT